MSSHVEIIKSSCDEKALTRALILVHKDILQNGRQACLNYCEKKLVEGLVARLISCEKTITLGLSLSLLNQIYTYGPPYKDALMQLEALEDSLLDLITPQKQNDQSDEAKHKLTLIYQEALKLLINLTTSSKYQQQLVSKGVLEKLKDILKNTCQFDAQFSDEAREFVTSLIVGKKLVGKIDPELSKVLKKGALSILSVHLYDTTSSKDVNINQTITSTDHAWQDIALADEPVKQKEEDMWCDFKVTKLVDANCFWAHIDNQAGKKTKSMSLAIEEHIYSSDVCTLEEVEVGKKICCYLGATSQELGWVRGCVLEVDEENKDNCLILLVDYGYIVKIAADHLFLLPEDLESLPHQAKLCVLRDVKPPPRNTKCLQLVLELLCNLTAKGHSFRMKLHQMGFSSIVTKLCKVSDKAVILRSMSLLGNMALNFNIRAQIGFMDGPKIITEMIRRYSDDNGALKVLLGSLINFIIESSQNRNKIASENILLVLLGVYRMSETTDENKTLITMAIKNLVGDGWRLIDPLNVPDVRDIIDEKIDVVKGCFNLPNMCGDDLLEEVRKRRKHKILKRGLRDHEALPDPTYMSISMDDLVKKLGGNGDGVTSSDPEKSESEPLERSNDTLDTLTANKSEDDSYDGYLYKRRVDVYEDVSHSFMLETNMNKIKAVDIGDTVCAFLNSAVSGTIFIGINKVGIVVGMNVCRKEHDNLRLGVDDLFGRFDPVVTHNLYEICFIPVMNKTQEGKYEQCEERFIIEIKVNKNANRTIFQTPAKKMFFRINGVNAKDYTNHGVYNVLELYKIWAAKPFGRAKFTSPPEDFFTFVRHFSSDKYTIQQIRERTVAEQEEKYKAEIRALQMTLEEAKKVGRKL